MKGWNDPPPQSVVLGDREPDNPFRRQPPIASIHSSHRRSYSSGGLIQNPLVPTTPGTPPNAPIPAIFAPRIPESASITATSPLVPPTFLGNHSIPATRSWSNFQNIPDAPKAVPEKFGNNIASTTGVVSDPRIPYDRQKSLPFNVPPVSQPVGIDENLATELQQRLNDLQFPNFNKVWSGSNRLSPLASPGRFSPVRMQNAGSPSSAAMIDCIEPDFELGETLPKVDFLFEKFAASCDESSHVEKMKVKLDSFRSSWNTLDESLANLVRKLVFCVLKCQTDLAMRCFIKLSIDYSNEVVLWSMAFKRLIRHFETNSVILSDSSS